MEAGEENCSDVSLKRPRAPLSDSEDNSCSAPETNDSQKRRRLEAAGQENRCPEPSSSGRQAELETKPDTPIVPSVRSRVQQLTQRRDGGAPLAQRCLSDPGGDSRGFREPLLGEAEFNQRMERFREPSFQSSPTQTLTPANPCPRTRSNFVSVIQQKLQGSTTPSSKQVSRIRQEREHELSQLPFQPITENAWLKRSSSDSSLAEERTPGPSCASFSVPRANRRVQWPPTCPWDDQGVGDVKDGSFAESPTISAQNRSLSMTGERASGLSEAPGAFLETGGKQERHVLSEEPRQEEEVEASAGNEEEQPGSQQPEAQTVLKLSFNEDHSFSKVPFGEDQDLSELTAPNEQSFFESTRESNVKETVEDSTVSEQGSSDMLTFEEDEKMDSSCFSEGEIEPSTDEELRMWRYPRSVMSVEEESVVDEVQEVCVKEVEGESSQMNKPDINQDGDPPSDVSTQIAGCSETQEDEKSKAEDLKTKPGSCSDISERDRSTLDRDRESMESCDGNYEELLTTDGDDLTIKQEQKDEEVCTRSDDAAEQSEGSHMVCLKGDHSRETHGVRQTKAAAFQDVTQALRDEQNEHEGLDRKTEDEARPVVNSETALMDTDAAQASAEMQASDQPETGQDAEGERLNLDTSMTEEARKAERGESSKKVTFILEPEFIYSSGVSDNNTSTETALSDAEVSFHDETNSGEMIEQMFEEVLEYAERMEDPEDHDSGIAACSIEKNKMETETEKEKSEEGQAKEGERDESDKLESIGDELLTFPPSGILSPLSKSVEAVVTPLRLAASQKPNPPLVLTPDETSTPPADSAPLYSIDAYRTQRQNKPPAIQSVTPGVQRQAQQTSKPQPSVSIKEKITALNEEAGKLQTVINQTLQALSCCTDEEHGRGSLEEAEAEKLLLVSCEKRSALLAEVTRLKEERSSESGEAAGGNSGCVSQQPCRGTVSITNIQLPLKVEYVCSSHNRAGRPSHYFFVLIRYGPYNIVATPLATAADAQNGDTISFPTSVTLEDIRPSFEIDVEVYSLNQTSAGTCSVERTSTKPRVTPRKLLSTLTRSSVSSTSAAPPLSSRRSSNFSLVGSHKITLASLGHSKFPLDKMKLDGKVKRLLGDEFQEKVPFLSPLEGNIYLQLESKSHSDVQHQGFLTMFELVSGYGVWHRRFFVLEGCSLQYWNYPNDRETKEAEGSVSLAGPPSQYVRPVERASCARPFTFELVSSTSQQEDDLSQEAVARCLFSADSKQERLDWMEKLNQALLDFHTWSRTQTESQQSNTSSSGNLRESIL
ncbi:anillin, actin binding protein 2 isoform X1 [Archocentrus centrarchus]|uniref:anillin, actin binding protein 2 isoform X1 n=1 Tax=Archocentrus centrarchus TaxID=63155 RepID=UPI0011EA47E7|nr:anillin-like isoform X1 [Archocentrus centrarchus]